MKRTRPIQFAGLALAAALMWGVSGGLGAPWSPLARIFGTSHAATPEKKPDNPCNPGKTQADNPCNPGKAGNPCNPCAAKAKAENPCNPCAAKAANPCNPNAGAASNPCNPNAAKAANPCNPDAAKAANPCNPGATRVSAGGTSGDNSVGSPIAWGQDFHSWDVVTGYVISNSHGNRLVQTYIYPPEATKVFKHNAELLRQRRGDGFLPFPPGTQIVQESWLRNDLGGPGQAGPVFFMRKEDGGYDDAGGNWHYAVTRNDFALLGEGHDGAMQFCKECHARAEKRDRVFATQR